MRAWVVALKVKGDIESNTFTRADESTEQS